MAVTANRPIEVLSRRTEDSETHQNPSGTSTVTLHAQPVRVKRGNGWAPIDTTLKAGRDGVRPVATKADIVLSGGGAGPVVTMRGDAGSFGLTWPGALPKPLLDKDTATYRDVWPGVDLTIRVENDGFAKTLVVKTREAAADPRLAAIRFGVTTSGLTMQARTDGGYVLVDAKGTVVYAGDSARMWDQPQAPAGYTSANVEDHEPLHSAAMPLKLDAQSVTIVPDRALLTAADTRFPVYIDPSSVGITRFDWTHVNQANGDKSYWSEDRAQAKVGYAYWSSTRTPWRSMFLFSTGSIIGKQVISARYGIKLDHSGSCDNSQVQLWHIWPNISRAAGVSWNNSAGKWVTHVATGWGHANESPDDGCVGEQPDMDVYFGLPDYPLVTTVMQNAARGDYGSQVTFGLKAQNESDRYQWKKFYPESAVVTVEYNTPPGAPAELSTVPATPCGTEAAPTRLGASFLTMGFSAQLNDPDGNLVYGELQVLKGATDTVAYPAPAQVGRPADPPYTTVRVARGAVAVWKPLPAASRPFNVGLSPNVLYSYRARTGDGVTTSAWTSRCFFIVDTAGPAQPTIESADFPEWTPVRNTGERGSVTFRHAAADTDVAGYYYGFESERLTGWVPADENGDATVPITLWRDPQSGLSEATLFVQAADPSGNRSAVLGPHVMTANDLGAVPPGRTGDVNGDGLGDVSALFDAGDDRLRAWTVTSTGTEFHTSYVGWDTGSNGASLVTRRTVQGDFTGDGLADHAMFRQDPDGRTRLFILRSGGHRFDVVGDPVWISPADPKWGLANMRISAGNIDGVGADDIVAMVKDGTSGWSAQVWRAADGHASTTAWFTQAPGQAPFVDSTALVGDYDGDGDADLATVTGAATDRTVMRVYTSNGSSFGAPTTWLDTTGFEYRRARFAVGNFDGDTTNGRGRQELVALYDLGGAQSRIVVFRSTGAAFTTAEHWWPATEPSGPFDARASALFVSDFNGDGTTDVGVFNDCCSVGNKELWRFTSSGTKFGDQQRVQELRVADKRRAQARWKLDAGSGTSLFDEYGDNPATAAGAPPWREGRTFVPTDKAINFQGNQWASTAGPVLRTDRSFTVSAWVYTVAAPGGGWKGAVSQDGTQASAFFLRWADDSHWVFTLVSADTMNPAHVNLKSNQIAESGKWTHLAGVYDAPAGEMRLYVNGALDAAAPISGVFNATGPLNIGRDRFNGAQYSTWQGGIDDVQVRDHVMSAYEIHDQANVRFQQVHWRMGSAHGTADSSGNNNPLLFSGPVTPTTDRAGDATGALAFNGTGQWANSTRAVVSGGSYTVSAWVKLNATGGTQYRGVVSQDGNQSSAFMLRYAGPTNQWVFTVVYTDTPNAPHVNLLSETQAQAGVWTHIAGVYDAASKTVRLYVDGVMRSWGYVPGTFYPNKQVNIGRDLYNGVTHSLWNGAIDDVRFHTGAMPEDEIRALASQPA